MIYDDGKHDEPAELTEVLTNPGHESAANPPPDACQPLAKPPTSKPGAPAGNTNALITGKHSRHNRLVDADFPKAAKHAAGKRDRWHRLVKSALRKLAGKPLTFAQIDSLRDAARHEAIVLLSEHRRRQPGLTAEQLDKLDSTIAAALAAKSRILARLGLQPVPGKEPDDDGPTLADLAGLQDRSPTVSRS